VTTAPNACLHGNGDRARDRASSAQIRTSTLARSISSRLRHFTDAVRIPDRLGDLDVSNRSVATVPQDWHQHGLRNYDHHASVAAVGDRQPDVAEPALTSITVAPSTVTVYQARPSSSPPPASIPTAAASM